MLCSIVAVLSAAPIWVLKVGPGSYSTLDQAVQAVRSNPSRRPAKIVLGKSVQVGTKTVLLDAKASNLTIEGTGTGTVLSGGPVVDRWLKVVDPKLKARINPAVLKSVVVAKLDRSVISGLGSFSRRGFSVAGRVAGLEVFYRGKPLRPARYPNPDAKEGGWLRIAEKLGDKQFAVADSRPKTWKSWKDVWVYGYWTYDWADSHEKVTAFDPSLGAVSTEAQGGAYGYSKGRRFFFNNVLEELDQPGEWWIDRETQTLAMIPPAPLRPGDITVSEIETPLLRIEGAKNVTVRGVLLEAGRTNGVEIQDSENCAVEKSTVRNFGQTGVVIAGGKNCRVVSSKINGNGESGVTMNGGDRKTLTPAGHRVEGCTISAISRWCRTYRPAVGVEGVGNVVAGNHIFDLPHTAVLLGGNDHLLERNLVERVCTDTGDAGAFYMGRNATTRGTVIRWNHFRDVKPKVSTEGNFTEVMSVYLDDCWCGTRIEGNIFERSGTAIMIGGGRDNEVVGNVFLDAHVGISFDARGRGWAKGLFVRGGEWRYMELMDEMKPLEPPYLVRYPALAKAIGSGADLSYPAGTVVKRNLAFGPGTWIRYQDGLTIKDIDYADNVVAQASKSLEQALKLAPSGFQRIPLDKIGPRK